MSENEFEIELDLLIPGNIPINRQLDTEVKEKLSKVITTFLVAIEDTSTAVTLSKIARALESLDKIETRSAAIDKTKTPLKGWEVEDYDRYFKINRIQTDRPELALVRGLLINTRTFLLLCQRGDRLDVEQIELQKQGFIAYARLLARNFNLNLPDI